MAVWLLLSKSENSNNLKILIIKGENGRNSGDSDQEVVGPTPIKGKEGSFAAG